MNEYHVTVLVIVNADSETEVMLAIGRALTKVDDKIVADWEYEKVELIAEEQAG